MNDTDSPETPKEKPENNIDIWARNDAKPKPPERDYFSEEPETLDVDPNNKEGVLKAAAKELAVAEDEIAYLLALSFDEGERIVSKDERKVVLEQNPTGPKTIKIYNSPDIPPAKTPSGITAIVFSDGLSNHSRALGINTRRELQISGALYDLEAQKAYEESNSHGGVCTFYYLNTEGDYKKAIYLPKEIPLARKYLYPDNSKTQVHTYPSEMTEEDFEIARGLLGSIKSALTTKSEN